LACLWREERAARPLLRCAPLELDPAALAASVVVVVVVVVVAVADAFTVIVKRVPASAVCRRDVHCARHCAARLRRCARPRPGLLRKEASSRCGLLGGTRATGVALRLT
jgi:hypothetical protein